MNKYLFLDTETGGLDSNTSLLTAYFAITNDKLEILSDLELTLKPDDGIYQVNGQALGINQINLVEHDKTALTYKDGGKKLYEFLANFKSKYTEPDFTFDKLIPIGQNVAFDIKRIQATILNRGTWERFVSYRTLDTAVISRYLQIVNLLPSNLEGGMHKLRDFFNIKIEGQDHSAKTDVLINIEVFRNLVTIGKLPVKLYV